jgi:hypothetical protein
MLLPNSTARPTESVVYGYGPLLEGSILYHDDPIVDDVVTDREFK